MLQVKDLYVSYGQSEALHGISFEANKNETVAIMGRNGMDKTTLFKSLMGVLPAKGGEISEWVSGGFDSYNPFSIKGRAAALSSMPLESLLTGTADEVGAAYCLLCETVEYPESRDWAIFTLREGIRFSDGTPMTAADVLFSYEQLRDKGLSSFRAVIAQMVASAEVLDDRRIRFNFTPDYPRRDLIQSVGGLPVFSRADFQANARELGESSARPFIGSGPYMFESADMGRSVRYVRNPDYWGAAPALERVTFRFISDPTAAFAAMMAGDVDAFPIYPAPETLPQIEAGQLRVQISRLRIPAGQRVRTLQPQRCARLLHPRRRHLHIGVGRQRASFQIVEQRIAQRGPPVGQRRRGGGGGIARAHEPRRRAYRTGALRPGIVRPDGTGRSQRQEGQQERQTAHHDRAPQCIAIACPLGSGRRNRTSGRTQTMPVVRMTKMSL